MRYYSEYARSTQKHQLQIFAFGNIYEKKKRNNNMIETRIAQQLNRIAATAAAANNNTNIAELAIILFCFSLKLLLLRI